ncbi:DUF624 domain-containing protein [Salipaludibacillus sp. CUR1]|uniref:YesL family protein n=1 Tax=Salipaludibacillus sp. CUR1 TaxID=2820003 RepID=UPI001E553FCF|nr:DUF624 domain-containing protein [Salipaludibacillus sp. CUR1]MCE7793925.1 DUF624 domain-containing protein [Salipaludibacillus sp. CUR1]
MEKGKVYGAIETFSAALYRLTLINFLWIIFSLAGLVIAGIAPATAAAHAATQRWVKNEEIEGKIVKYFWMDYKKYFVKSNMVWGFLLITGSILYADFYFIFRLDSSFAPMLLGLGIFLLVLYLIIFFYSIPLLIHLKMRVWESIKYAFIFGFSSPVLTVSGIGSFFVIQYLLFQFPVLYLFFSISIFSYITMNVVNTVSIKLKLSD